MTNEILIAVVIGLVVGLAVGITLGVTSGLPSKSNNLPTPSPALNPTPTAAPQQNETASLTDFNNYKIALLNYYNQQTTAHAGYIIALAVGLFTILYQIKPDGFFDNRWFKRVLIFYLPLSIILGAMLFFILRIVYWGWMSSAVLGVSITNPIVVPTLSGLQSYLAWQFQLGTGWTSLFYLIDKDHTGLSFVILSITTFLLILGTDFSYANYGKKEEELQKSKNWHENSWIFVVILMIVIIAILVFLGLYSSLVTPTLKNLVNPSWKQPPLPLS